MGTKKVKKTKQVRKIDPNTGDWTTVTETYYDTVSTNDGGSYSDYCGSGGDSGGGYSSCD